MLIVTVTLNKKEREKNTFFLSFYDEIFINLSATPFDRNRLYGAVGYQFLPNANIQLGYLAQTVNTTTKEYLQAAVFYNIDFRKKEWQNFSTQNIHFKLGHLTNTNKQILILDQGGALWMDIQKKLERNGYKVNLEICNTNSNIPHLVICDADTLLRNLLLQPKKRTKIKFHFGFVYLKASRKRGFFFVLLSKSQNRLDIICCIFKSNFSIK